MSNTEKDEPMTRIPARAPEGEEHHIVYAGPRHLIPDETWTAILPALPEGQEWVLVHRVVEPQRSATAS